MGDVFGIRLLQWLWIPGMRYWEVKHCSKLLILYTLEYVPTTHCTEYDIVIPAYSMHLQPVRFPSAYPTPYPYVFRYHKLPSTCNYSSLPALRPCRTLYPLRFGPLQMSRRDPTFVVRLGATRHSRAIRTNDTDLVGRIDLLGAAGGFLGALAAFAAATLLGEEGGDPGAVDEITGAGEGGEEEEVEEDSGGWSRG